MELSQIRAVLAVAEYHSFSRAAEELYLSQSTLSLQVAKLEKELGVSLFARTTRTVKPTEAGEEFIKSAGDILRGLQTLGQNMSAYAGLLRGTLKIGTITSLERIRFSEMLAAFYSAHPQLNIDIREAGSYTLLEMLRSHTAAQAFLAVDDISQHPDIEFTPLGSDEYHLAVSAAHPLAGRGTVELAEVKEENFIFHQPEQSVSDSCLRACREAGFEPRIICRSSVPTIGFSLIRAGIGIGLYPAEEFERLHDAGVVELHLAKPVKKKIYLAALRGAELSRLDKTFADFACGWYRD